MKALLRQILGGLGYEVRNTRRRLALVEERARQVTLDDAVCRLMFEREAALSFIQVGAFDGVTCDPLRRYIERCGWRGVMLEPQPGPAAALRKLYDGNDRIEVLQAALGEAPGERTLYTVDTDIDWAGGLASFDKAVILKHAQLVPGLENRIHEVAVRCVRFDEVLERVPAPDILQIDTEGADAYILSLFPFERVKPAIVNFEIKHLSWRDRRECLERLSAHGYRFAPGDQDMLATLEN